MIITMYRDTASHYGLCEDSKEMDDNSVALDIPTETLKDYYNDKIEAYEDNPMPFEQWINEEYTHDDMEDLLGYIVDTEGDLRNVERR